MTRTPRGLGIILPLVILVVWEGAAEAGLVEATALPAPSGVLQAAWQEVVSGRLLAALGHSLVVILTGWSLAVVGGVVLGVAIGVSSWARRLSATSVDFARSVPAVALVPVGILIFGFDLRAELVVVVFAALWPTLINTVGGVEMVPTQLHAVATTLRLSGWDRVRKIVLPAALPRILVGVRLSMATAVVLTAVAEMTGNPAGVGSELVMAQSSVRPDTAMAYVVVIGMVGLVLNMVLVAAERHAVTGRTVGSAA